MNLPSLILDLGSHSAKLYRYEDHLTKIGTASWQLLENEFSSDTIRASIDALTKPFRDGASILAIGTEAMRRSPHLEQVVSEVCSGLGISYQTITQEYEALLIYRAFQKNDHIEGGLDIVNAGGGSIQIVKKNGAQLLLGFGISDLNRDFCLAAERPDLRKFTECVTWVYTQLQCEVGNFAYTGGEETYLRSLGVPINRGRCSVGDFTELVTMLNLMPMSMIEKLSPFDSGWMRGAVASNAIVTALLKKNESSYFVPSDFNIAHGLILGIMK